MYVNVVVVYRNMVNIHCVVNIDCVVNVHMENVRFSMYMIADMMDDCDA